MKKNTKKKILYYITLFLPITTIILSFLILLPIYKFNDNSMNQSFAVSSIIKGKIERGDVIIFKDEENKNVARRIVGIPGDKIRFNHGDLYINELLCEEDYTISDSYTLNTFEVPEGCYFVLSDNRDYIDSRFYKNPYISNKSILKKVIFMF